MVTRSTVNETDAEGAIVLKMAQFEFSPGSTTVSPGQNLLVTNSDPFAHDFALEEYDISEYFGPGNEGIIDLSTVDPSTGEGMSGELVIDS